ncbi:hypothetical protein FA15DRAFT_703820 [Coprinopsis marcescibilis]|uniref:Uncharacterized protein n=1 Tax=Coprinopsis marcescibilis TaxID=230819 RepID=A0A5C3KXU6_COPMA|nr:hypothetical protein FA15DRAFT_703820 [Coprinopsis marcescibilis]
MVRASTIVVAALAIVPVLALPQAQAPEEFSLRSVVDDNVDLEARKFKFGKAFKKLKGFAKIATKIAAPGAGALLGRDIEEADLDARGPTVHLAPHHPHHAHHPASPTASPPATPHHAHHARDLDLDDGAELDARDFEDSDELEARTPLSPTNFSRAKLNKLKGGLGSKGGRKNKGTRKNKNGKGKSRGGKSKGKGPRNSLKAHAGRRLGAGLRRGSGRIIGAHPRSLEDIEDEVFTRELDTEFMLDELVERGILEIADFDLETREPKFRFGNFLKKAVGVAGKVARVGAQLALREEDEMEVRSDFEILDELD